MTTGMRLHDKWLLAVPTVFLAVILYRTFSSPETSRVVINEVCSNNFSLIQDETGQYADYVELFEYIGVDSSLITGEIRFAIVTPAEGKCEYLSALEDGMETCGGVISFSDNREEENAYTICLEGLPCLRVTDLPASGIRMIFVKDNRARAFDFY